MRTLSADWMANTSKADPDQNSLHQETEDMRQNTFYPRAVAPTAAQVLIMFFYLLCSYPLHCLANFTFFPMLIQSYISTL
jgi:hypothetical protein